MSDQKIVKIMLAIRHTLKGGPAEFGGDLPGGVIGKVGRDRITAMKFPVYINSARFDAFGSGCLRTHQCLFHLVVDHELQAVSHDALFNMGSDELFNGWIEKGLRDAAAEMGTLFLGVLKILGGEKFEKTAFVIAGDIKNAFSVMKYDIGLGFFHSPTIEMAAWSFDNNVELSLKEDEGVVFVQLEDGSVHYYGTWLSGDDIPDPGDDFEK
ncbi:MAG: hypothetical protein Q8P20_05045 [bacterium]|nr:hypothetical protein [bacterium]